MNAPGHEPIQRCAGGELPAEEIGALQEALSADAGLRALYLDYVNLDTALGVLAETRARAGPDKATVFPRPSVRPAPRAWRWRAAATASAALIMFALLARHRAVAPERPDIAAVTASTHTAISRLHADVPSVLPAWMSPTASLLDGSGSPN
jgi:hypothetical protein